ncbi:phosphatidylglycerol lysyltransferase domain-containing protein [Nocardioides terrisoli]|uniref:phosphatidylglycerol lysyltransferase domain-containing protein n=1 Tax=Nocardioides terrisoli TaxID=3388267 RepID=UPI00287B6273|nr:phosphatidylglycerol lysyltransferase domain-containing protein [Nocardioides marmorisolisilvae]
MPTPEPAPADIHARVRELVALSVDDPLAPFALRPEKLHVFSPDGRAAVSYRLRCGLAVAGGDPVGDVASWPAAIDTFMTEVASTRRGAAVLGAGELARDLWEGHGLSAVAIGRDVVVRPDDFELVGRHFRNLRQAIKRTHNSGVTVESWLERDVPATVRMELRNVVIAAKRDEERGFAMTLGRPFDGGQPESLVLVARDHEGRLVASHRYLVAGHKDLSLDVPIRLPGAPNGVDERLIAEAVAWAGKHDFDRVSLAFAPFPELFAERRHLGLAKGAAYRLVHLLDPLIKVERLYRYLRKFHAFDQQRHVMLRWRQLPRVATALLLLEFGR